ncbi:MULTISPECIES: hypothetical protein [Bacteroides]|uniref:hypothetical protein n=1 Tax=Bacteroides TaxID=816 RepID=UPI00202F39EF|nr:MULTISPECIES: hypothetical protein [Bacteroides]
MKSLNLYFTGLADNGGSDGSGIRFGKCPPKRIFGYLNVPFLISSNRSFLESCCK